jgi:lipopolysaccharide assembly outer membrane protein LptD (OstA)
MPCPYFNIVNFKFLQHRVALLAGPLTLGVLLAGCGGGDSRDSRSAAQNAIKSDAQTAKSQVDQVKGITLKGGELSGPDAKGRPLWRIAAKEIRVFNEGAGEKKNDKQSATEELTSTPKRAELTDGTATLYRDGKIDSTFRAPKISFQQTDKGVRLSMSGGVAVQSLGAWSESRGPVTMTAPRAEVDVKARRLWAGKGVRLLQGKAGEQINVVADQMRADTNLKATFLSGGVKASSAQGKFSASEANWNWQTNRAGARGAITATHDKTTITGQRLDADVGAGRGTLSGEVRAAGEQGKATASSVRYDWKAGTLLAAGGVVLTKEAVQVRAGQISSDDKFNRATASGGVTLIKDGATLKAARIETAGKGDKATAGGGVLLTRADGSVSAGSATAYNLGEKNARIEASGNVRVKRGDVDISASRATATGLSDKNALRVVASGGVTATNKDGEVRSSSATYGGGNIVASGGVTLLKDGHRLSGSRLTTDEKFTLATLSGDVSGRLAKGETISAGTLIYRKDKGVEGLGGVSARKDDLRLRADKLKASPDGNDIILTGNVVVTNSEGATIRSASARYDRAAQKVFASGQVFFTDPKRGLKQRGTGLVADLDLQKATLTGVSGSGKMNVFDNKKIF